MSLSIKSGEIGNTSHKGFMSRVSSVLLSTKKQRRSKSKPPSPPDSVFTKGSPSLRTEASTSYLNVQTQELEPGYSTIHDHNKMKQRSAVNDSPPPAVPPKSDDLYATVKKKGTTKREQESAFASVLIHKDNSDEDSTIGFAPSHRGRGPSKVAQSSRDNSDNEVARTGQKANAKSAKSSKQHSRRMHRAQTSAASSHGGHARKRMTHYLHSSDVPDQSEKTAQNRFLVETSDEKHLVAKIARIKQRHHEEIMYLRQEMQHTDNENEALRTKVADLMKNEYKWKQEVDNAASRQKEHVRAVESNAELSRRIAKLEIDTRQEVQLLCLQVKAMKHEKEQLSDQLRTSELEQQSLQKKYDQFLERQKQMVSVERHIQALEENKKFLEEIQTKYELDTSKLQHMVSEIEDQRNALSVKMLVLEEQQKVLQEENSELRRKLVQANDQKDEKMRQLDQMKTQHDEASNALVSLLRTTEHVIAERDAMLNKAQLQERQNQMIHSSVMEHSINVGRLEEHIMNLRKRMKEEVMKAAASKRDKEMDMNRLKESYELQMSLLREKVLQKNSSLDILGREKRQLESDLENLWATTLASEKQTHSFLKWNKLALDKVHNH